MKTKDRVVVPFSIKAAAVDAGTRTFEGIAAIFSLDLGGDIIKPGAFTQTLKEWKTSGNAIPLLNSHDHWDIMSALGQLLEAKETKDGLWTKWEVIPGADGDRVMDRIRPSERTGRAIIGKLSIGFEPMKFDFEQVEGGGPFDRIRNLRAVNLREVSLVLFPMAQDASIDASSVKSFLKSAQTTKPEQVTVEVKQDLRRLATRIGILLATGKKAEGEPPAEEAPEATAPAPETEQEAPKSAPSATVPSPATASGDPTADVSDENAEVPAEEAKAEETDGPVYLYAEALEHRVKKVLLNERVSRIKQA